MRHHSRHFVYSNSFNSHHKVSVITCSHFIDKEKLRHREFKDSSQDHRIVNLGFDSVFSFIINVLYHDMVLPLNEQNPSDLKQFSCFQIIPRDYNVFKPPGYSSLRPIVVK